MIDFIFALFSSVFSLVKNALVDFVVYVLVDVVAKTPLREASSETEKRLIWLYETVILMGVSLAIYAFFHPPYILWLLTAFTFLYTQLLGRVNFRYWWQQLWTKWDEFQQHEESMEKLHELRAQHASVSMNQVSAIPPPNTHWIPPGQQAPTFPPFMFQPNMAPVNANMGPSHPNPGIPPEMMLPAEPWYPADSNKGKTQVTSAPASSPGMITLSEPQVTSTPTQPRYRGPPMPMQHSPPPHFPPSPSLYSRVPDYMFANNKSPMRGPSPHGYMPLIPRGPELNRKPLPGRSYLASPPNQRVPPPSSIRSRVMSALGLNPFSTTPPGLRNSGQNICFLNSVLQCLTHSPGLLQCLTLDSERLQCSNAEAALVTSLTELVQALTAKPGTSEVSVLDATPVRQAASSLPGSMVTHPSQSQQQQDVAEFFMWILHVLHNALNINRPNQADSNGSIMGMDTDIGRHPASPRYTSVTLNMLKFIYGDLNPQRIHELKAACRKEIENAADVDNDMYAEPLQRLADLEWLTYKEGNNSAIDDLFTGQMVEAQQCLACNRISVCIQTFNILPVPLVEPRNLNGLVYLEDCFGKFGNVEDLLGPDGLQCENCNKRHMAQIGGGKMATPTSTFTPTSTVPRVMMQQSLPLGASPILPNGGTGGRGLHHDLHKRRLRGSDSAVYSSIGGTPTPMSPIANMPTDVFNDSGFQDHQFKTSTPILTGPPPQLTDGQRRSLLRQLPECLVVQLLRFSYVSGRVTKDHRPVSIPLINLDLTQLIVDNVMKREDLTALNASYRYELYAVCLHLGSESAAYGHYVNYTRASNNAWYKYDDEHVTGVNMDYELNTRQVRENAYLLFYRKMPVQ